MTDRGITLNRSTSYFGKGIRYVSAETTLDLATGKQEPVLELTDIGGHVLHLSFVRSTPERTLDFLLQKTLSYAKRNGFHRVELQDDAFFKTNAGATCMHRELFHRVFSGKKGIYESKGWTPVVQTDEMIACIAGFTKGAAKELGALLGAQRLMNSFADDDRGSFGAWINAQPCVTLNFFYNALLSLASKKTLPPISDGAQRFLKALHDLRIANNSLCHDPAFTPPTK